MYLIASNLVNIHIMRSLYIFLPLFLIVNLSYQCCPKEEKNIICFEFDQRQCAGDEWADLVPINDSKDEREQKMLDYLESKNIEVKEVNLVIEFHEGVCEACFICPEQDRFFVKIAEEDEAEFTELDLLNSGKVECGDAF